MRVCSCTLEWGNKLSTGDSPLKLCDCVLLRFSVCIYTGYTSKERLHARNGQLASMVDINNAALCALRDALRN